MRGKDFLLKVVSHDDNLKVSLQIEAGTFIPEKTLNHTHEGSIGNLGNDHITNAFKSTLANFNFEKVDKALTDLVK